MPDELLHEAGRDIGRWPETRVCAVVAGAASLFVTAQLHDLQAREPLLRRIRATRPGIEIDDRQIVLRSVKSWGRLLTPDGQAVDVVPVNPWTQTVPYVVRRTSSHVLSGRRRGRRQSCGASTQDA